MPAIVIAILVVLGLAGGGGAFAAQSSLPGDPLYPVKTSLDQISLKLATSDEARVAAYLRLAERRLNEMDVLVRAGRWDQGVAVATAATGYLTSSVSLIERIAGSGRDVTSQTTRWQQDVEHYVTLCQAYAQAAQRPDLLPGMPANLRLPASSTSATVPAGMPTMTASMPMTGTMTPGRPAASTMATMMPSMPITRTASPPMSGALAGTAHTPQGPGMTPTTLEPGSGMMPTPGAAMPMAESTPSAPATPDQQPMPMMPVPMPSDPTSTPAGSVMPMPSASATMSGPAQTPTGSVPTQPTMPSMPRQTPQPPGASTPVSGPGGMSMTPGGRTNR